MDFTVVERARHSPKTSLPALSEPLILTQLLSVCPSVSDCDLSTVQLGCYVFGFYWRRSKDRSSSLSCLRHFSNVSTFKNAVGIWICETAAIILHSRRTATLMPGALQLFCDNFPTDPSRVYNPCYVWVNKTEQQGWRRRNPLPHFRFGPG